MKLLIKPLLICFLLFSATTIVYSQKIKITSGSLKFLKSVDTLNVEYSYSDMGVGRFESEEEYLKEKVSAYNEKEPGKGDAWVENWNANKKQRFEPIFEEALRQELEKANVSVGYFPQAKYTLLLNCTHLEPGFDVGVMSKKANAHYEVIFIEKGKEEKLATMTIFAFVEAGGIGYNFDMGGRIQDVFAKTGKGLGYYLWKKVYR